MAALSTRWQTISTRWQTGLREPLEILIVGCGCSGALLGRHIRDREKGIACSGSLPKGRKDVPPAVALTFWEWARGPAGRMASYYSSASNGKKTIADVGAQVLSVQCPLLADRLRSCNAVDSFGLASNTRQRRHDSTHFWMPEGFSQYLHGQILSSQPDEVTFQRRVLGLQMVNDRFEVEAEVKSPHHELARGRFSTGRYQPEPEQHITKEYFDAVVLAVTAKDALRIGGVSGFLGSEVVAALSNVHYDMRLSLTLVLSHKCLPAVEELFCGGQSEIDFESSATPCSEGVLGMLAWQDQKLRAHGEAVVLVAHSCSSFASENLLEARLVRQTPEKHCLLAVFSALASKLGVTTDFLQECLLDLKVIHWHQAQVQRFIHQLNGQRSCYVDPGVKTRRAAPFFALCGDYFTEASFSGCDESASATAQNIVDWVQSRHFGIRVDRRRRSG